MVNKAVEEAVLDARMEILGTNIYFGGFAARMRWVFSKRFPAAATDGKSIFLNPDFIEGLLKDVREVKGLVMHEIGHPALGHSLRKGNRNHQIWNLACDYALNQILKQDGLRLPEGALLASKYYGMSAEEIYADLIKNGPAGRKAQDEVLDPPHKQGPKGKDKSKSKSKSKSRDSKDDAEDSNESDDADQKDGREREGKSGDKQDKAGKAGDEKQSEDESDAPSASDEESDGQDEDEDQTLPEDGEDGDDGENGYGEDDSDEDEDFGSTSSDDEGEDEVLIDPAAHQEGKEAETLDPMSEWRLTVANLSAMAKRAGQMGAGLQSEVEAIKKSSVDWKAALANMLESIDSNEDFSWSRPDRRMSGAEFLFPGEFSEKSKDLIVHLDTSGSVFAPEAQEEFLAHFNDLVKARSFRKVIMIHVDTRVCHVEEFDTADGIPTLDGKHQAYGGGGTCFAPSMVWLKDHEEIEPAGIVYLTDMYGSFPDEAQVPNFPMIWLAINGMDQTRNEEMIPEHLKQVSTVITVSQDNM